MPRLPDHTRLLETIPIIVRDAQNVVNAVIPALAAGRLTSAQHARAVACLQGALRALEEIKPPNFSG